MSKPLVTAVIPTRNRPELVCRAVRSALAQTYANLEVVVVIDGPDPSTVQALEALNEPRLRVVALEENVGGSEARNIGVRGAKGEWIALLDDDDEWFPNKTDLQIRAAKQSSHLPVVVACQYIDRTLREDRIRPRVSQRRNQPISEFLFCEISLFQFREGFLQTSTLMVPRSLLVDVTFTPGLKRNQDTDWLLRAIPMTKTEVLIVPIVLAVFHNEHVDGRISKHADWQDSFNWALEARTLFTRKAFAFYLATQCLPIATLLGSDYRTVIGLLSVCRKFGTVTPKILWFFLRYSVLAPSAKRVLPRNLSLRAKSVLSR